MAVVVEDDHVNGLHVDDSTSGAVYGRRRES
jgi:hypothetical protein